MARAGLFIGVDRTGTLPVLNDAAAAAKRMHAWALSQGMADGTHAKLITDAGGKKVDPAQILDAIEKIIDGPGVDQLIVYFAGHGVNICRSEQWLLSDAPRNSNAAVNMSGSVDLAHYCGIPHVVFISDACRVAPEGIQAQGVRGSDIFPNEGGGDKAKPVDQFFACCRGRTAAEVKDSAIAAEYSSLYTNALLDALSGKSAEVLEPTSNGFHVRPIRLAAYLDGEIPSRIRDLHLEKKLIQTPEAIINHSPIPTWIAHLDKSAVAPITRSKPRSTPQTLQLVARKLVRSAVLGDRAVLDEQLRQAHITPVAGARQLASTAKRIALPFGADHFESKCGIKVRGARMVDFCAPRALGELLGGDGDTLRLSNVEAPAASVLLRFEGGAGTVVPAIPGFIAAITFGDGDLVDVAYEPSANTGRWGLYEDRAAEIRALRAIAASSTDHGRFHLDKDDSIEIERRMQYAKGIDPTLAVYAAYAYYDLEAVDRIRQMSGYLQGDIGATLFDLELLGRRLIGKRVEPEDRVVPFIPLLSQGWALLRAQRVALHPALSDIERSLRDSLWSLFDAAGAEKLTQALQSKEVR